MDSTQANPDFEPLEYHVLCVDDDPEFLKSMSFILQEKTTDDPDNDACYRFSFLGDPMHTLELVKELQHERETIAMVISDQKMPRMKGTELLREVKKITPDTILVLLTGYAGIESAIEAINHKLLEKYLTKPIEDENDFAASIRHLLQRFQMNRTIREQSRAIQNLYRFANVLNGLADLQETLDYVVQFSQEALQCDKVYLMLVQNQTLRVAAAAGISRTAIQPIRLLAVEADKYDFPGDKAVFVKTLQDVPFLKNVADGESFAGLPGVFAEIVSKKKMLGMVGAFARVDGLPFRRSDLDIATYIADTASIAIHNQLNRTRIEIARDQAEAANTGKSEFIANMSQKLLTPVRDVLNVAELGMDTNLSKSREKLSDYFQEIYQNGRFLSQLLQNLLDLANLQSGKMTFQFTETNLNELIRSVVNDFLLISLKRNISIVFNEPETVMKCMADADKIKQVVRNILANAVQYSPFAGQIDVITYTDENVIRIAIGDQGAGIPTEKLDSIFQKFINTPETTTSARDLSFGLAICREIINKHRGRLWAQNQSPHGALLCFELPTIINFVTDTETKILTCVD